jgi:hypothetical protein
MKLSYPQIMLVCIAVLMLTVNLCCKKGALPPGEISVNALIVNEADPAADGCGWLIKTAADTVYHATNLSAKYEIDSLKIHINYHKLAGKYSCGEVSLPLNGGIPQIQIDAIGTR